MKNLGKAIHDCHDYISDSLELAGHTIEWWDDLADKYHQAAVKYMSALREFREYLHDTEQIPFDIMQCTIPGYEEDT